MNKDMNKNKNTFFPEVMLLQLVVFLITVIAEIHAQQTDIYKFTKKLSPKSIGEIHNEMLTNFARNTKVDTLHEKNVDDLRSTNMVDTTNEFSLMFNEEIFMEPFQLLMDVVAKIFKLFLRISRLLCI